MPENPLEEARLDHVSESGELIIMAGRSPYTLPVNEALERAILEAKQIRSEALKFNAPPAATALPISQIQALIRGGADPARVAERYRLSETLVRHFSTAVETEKQYAVEQFLSVPAPKESRVRTVSDLIERTLSAAHIAMESVIWRATRRGLEPWRISAQFDSASRQVRAEWTWNMHDNAVVCANAAARKLFGERNVDDAVNADSRHADTPLTDSVAHDGRAAGSRASTRRPHTPTVWNMPQTTPANPASSPSQTAEGNAAAHTATRAKGSVALPKRPIAQNGQSGARTQTFDALEAVADEEPTHRAGGTGRGHEANADGEDARSTSHVTGDTASAPRSPDEADHAEPKTSKRKSSRSAVPSWDEILFGD